MIAIIYSIYLIALANLSSDARVPDRIRGVFLKYISLHGASARVCLPSLLTTFDTADEHDDLADCLTQIIDFRSAQYIYIKCKSIRKYDILCNATVRNIYSNKSAVWLAIRLFIDDYDKYEDGRYDWLASMDKDRIIFTIAMTLLCCHYDIRICLLASCRLHRSGIQCLISRIPCSIGIVSSDIEVQQMARRSLSYIK